MGHDRCTERKTTRRLARALGAFAACLALFVAPQARADDVATNSPSWSTRYDAARKHLVDREYREAESAFLDLALDAPTDVDRRLAVEMARVAATWASREAPLPPATEPTGAAAFRPRTRDEITLLYASSFLYGAGTGAWFLLQTQPDSAFTATLPFIGITAAPIIALAVIDGHSPLPYGMPQGIADGLYVGFGESLLLVTYQHARAHRVDAGKLTSSRMKPEDAATVLWGGATLGAVVGGTLSAGLPTTPGRASYTTSVTIWSGLLTGFAFGAILPENDYRGEHALLAANFGYGAGALTGLMTATTVSPSTTRVRLTDLSGVAGGLIAGGSYLALAHTNTEPRVTLGLTAIGAATGLGLGWVLTRRMPRELPSDRPLAPQVTIEPTLAPVLGGAVVGVGGTL